MVSEISNDETEVDSADFKEATNGQVSWGINEIEAPAKKVAYEDDRQFYRALIHYLGLTLLVSLASVAALAVMGKEIPQIYVAVTSGIVGVAGAIFGVRK